MGVQSNHKLLAESEHMFKSIFKAIIFADLAACLPLAFSSWYLDWEKKVKGKRYFNITVSNKENLFCLTLQVKKRRERDILYYKRYNFILKMYSLDCDHHSSQNVKYSSKYNNNQ